MGASGVSWLFFPRHNSNMKKEVSLPRWKLVSLKEVIFIVQKVRVLVILARFYLLFFVEISSGNNISPVCPAMESYW